MELTISDECMICGRCFNNCPVNCIFTGKLHYEINRDECISCGTCAVVCPISAISDKSDNEK